MSGYPTVNGDPGNKSNNNQRGRGGHPRPKPRHSNDNRQFNQRPGYPNRDRKLNSNRDGRSAESEFIYHQQSIDLNDESQWPSVQESSTVSSRSRNSNSYNESNSVPASTRQGQCRSPGYYDRKSETFSNYSYNNDNWNRGGGFRRNNSNRSNNGFYQGQQNSMGSQGYSSYQGNRPNKNIRGFNTGGYPRNPNQNNYGRRNNRSFGVPCQFTYFKPDNVYPNNPIYDEPSAIFLPMAIHSTNQISGTNNIIDSATDPNRDSTKIRQASIIKQVEYYFSEANLERDFSLRSIMNQDGYVSLETVFDFKRIQAMNITFDFFVKAICLSDKLDVDVEKSLIRPANNPTKWLITSGTFTSPPSDIYKPPGCFSPPNQVQVPHPASLPFSQNEYSFQPIIMPHPSQAFFQVPGVKQSRYFPQLSYGSANYNYSQWVPFSPEQVPDGGGYYYSFFPIDNSMAQNPYQTSYPDDDFPGVVHEEDDKIVYDVEKSIGQSAEVDEILKKTENLAIGSDDVVKMDNSNKDGSVGEKNIDDDTRTNDFEMRKVSSIRKDRILPVKNDRTGSFVNRSKMVNELSEIITDGVYHFQIEKFKKKKKNTRSDRSLLVVAEQEFKKHRQKFLNIDGGCARHSRIRCISEGGIVLSDPSDICNVSPGFLKIGEHVSTLTRPQGVSDGECDRTLDFQGHSFDKENKLNIVNQHISHRLLRTGCFDQKLYENFRNKAVLDHRYRGPGKSREMNSLYYFWCIFLRENFDIHMYSEFKSFAISDVEHGYRYGVECLFRFYSYGLEINFKPDIFLDFEELTLNETFKGDLYGLEKYWAFLKYYKGQHKVDPNPEILELLKNFTCANDFRKEREKRYLTSSTNTANENSKVNKRRTMSASVSSSTGFKDPIE